MKPYKATGWYWLMEPVSMIVRASLSGFLLTDICLPGARRMRLVLSFGIALIYAWGGAGNQRLSAPIACSTSDSILTQALVISDGKPFKSPAVNMVASTFWFFVASTIFMALCVMQDVLTLPQLRGK